MKTAYLRSCLCQYKVEVLGLDTQDATVAKFGLTIKVKLPMVRYRYPSGVKGVASMSLVSETPFKDLPIGS